MPIPLARPISATWLALLLVSCSSVREPGWRGEGAQPFGPAHARCVADSEASAQPSEREAQVLACMAAQGWTRDEPDPR